MENSKRIRGGSIMRKNMNVLLLLLSSVLLTGCSFDYGRLNETNIFENRFTLLATTNPKANINLSRSYFDVKYNGNYFYHLEFKDSSVVEDQGTYYYENNSFTFKTGDEITRKMDFRNYYEVNEKITKDNVSYTITWHAKYIFD